MGDNLPELLYRELCSNLGLSYGTDETPSFHNLKVEQRWAWERVAAKAIEQLNARFAGAVDDARKAHAMNGDVEGAHALSILHARYGRA